jgi:hypothetical protein
VCVHHQALRESLVLFLGRAVGCRLLAFCTVRGWSHSAERIMHVLLSHTGAPYKAILEEVQALEHGFSLLHLAVQSGVLQMVAAVLHMGEEQDEPWAWATPGPLGLTPLHLAAVGKGHEDIAEFALKSDPGEQNRSSCQCSCGLSGYGSI